jgi:hypothetical protein
MPTKTALKQIEKLQLIAEHYSIKFDKKISEEDAKNYTAEYISKLNKENSKKLKERIIAEINQIRNDVIQHNEIIDKRKKEILFPLLSEKHLENERARGEMQISNANSIFQIHYLNGNPDYVIDELKSMIDDTFRRDYFTTLLNQIITFPPKDDQQMKAVEVAKMIKAEFEEKTGVSRINEANKINQYGELLANLSEEMVDKEKGKFYLPDYGSDDYQDKVELARISIKTGIDVGENIANPGDGISGVA